MININKIEGIFPILYTFFNKNNSIDFKLMEDQIKLIFEQRCHGIAALAAMIPQTGDTAAWGARIDKGIDILYGNAINGYTGELGMMPAKGGNPALSDEEVKAAVDYIINQVK